MTRLPHCQAAADVPGFSWKCRFNWVKKIKLAICLCHLPLQAFYSYSNLERETLCFFLLAPSSLPLPVDLIIFPFTFCPNSKLPILWIAKQPQRRWGVERERGWGGVGGCVGGAKIERDLCKHNHVLKWKCGALNKSYISPVPFA